MMQLGVEHSLSMPERVPRQESPSMDGVCTSSSVVMPVPLCLGNAARSLYFEKGALCSFTSLPFSILDSYSS